MVGGVTVPDQAYRDAQARQQELERRAKEQQDYDYRQELQRRAQGNGGAVQPHAGPTTPTTPRRDPAQDGRDAMERQRQNSLRLQDEMRKKKELELQAKLQADAEKRRLDALKGVLGDFGFKGGAGGFGGGGGGQPGGSGGGPVIQPSPGAAMSGSDAAFARSKDKVGQASRGAVDSLRDLYAGSGNRAALNRGYEGVINTGLSQIGEQTRDQAIFDSNRAASVDDRNYAGDLTRRGQDMGIIQQILGGLTRLY